MDVSMHIDKDYTNEQKHEIVNNAISELYPQLVLNSKNVCTYNSHLWSDNLLSDTLERFLKRDIDAKWKVFMQGKLERYITSAMSMALHSSTSPFYFTYRKPNNAFRELLLGDGGLNYEEKHGYGADAAFARLQKERYEIIHEKISEMFFYDRQLIRDYFFEGLSLKDMEEKYNINSQRVGRDIKKALHKLKKVLKQEFDL